MGLLAAPSSLEQQCASGPEAAKCQLIRSAKLAVMRFFVFRRGVSAVIGVGYHRLNSMKSIA